MSACNCSSENNFDLITDLWQNSARALMKVAKCILTHLFPVYPFSTPWNIREPHSFRMLSGRYRKDELARNGLDLQCSLIKSFPVINRGRFWSQTTKVESITWNLLLRKLTHWCISMKKCGTLSLSVSKKLLVI